MVSRCALDRYQHLHPPAGAKLVQVELDFVETPNMVDQREGAVVRSGARIEQVGQRADVVSVVLMQNLPLLRNFRILKG